MQYHVCPDCGAHLDFGERCDCKNEREDTSDAAEVPSQKEIIATSSLTNPPVDVNSLNLRDLRQATGAMAKDAALVIREVFPKFNRQLLAQCEAWDKYGIVLHPDGLQALCKTYGIATGSKPTHMSKVDSVKYEPTSGLTQCERILRHMKDYGSITSLEAMQEYGIMRLASRITDLKQQGYDIVSKTECGRNRYGEKTSYSRYSLKEKHYDT